MLRQRSFHCAGRGVAGTHLLRNESERIFAVGAVPGLQRLWRSQRLILEMIHHDFTSRNNKIGMLQNFQAMGGITSHRDNIGGRTLLQGAPLR
jgi:hypothetical protein